MIAATTRLKALADIRVSSVDKKTVNGDVPVRLCNYTDVYYGDDILESTDFMEATATEEQIARFTLRADDVLFTKDSESPDDIAVPAYVPRDLDGVLCGYHLAMARAKPDRCVGRFLYWAFQSKNVMTQFEVAANGVTRFGLRLSSIGEVVLPAPSVHHQQAVSRFLDAECGRMDRMRAEQRALIDLVAERTLARQSELCLRGVVSSGTRDSGQWWMRDIPAHWNVLPLKYTARMESGHTPSRNRPELWENCTIPWISLNDVSHMAQVEYIAGTTNLVSDAGIAASSARVLPIDTVVLSRDATVGRTSIMAIPMATSQHFADWICGPDLSPRYLWLLFETAMQPYFDSLTAGSTIKTIGMPELRSFIIPLPPLNEQNAIVTAAEEVRLQAADLIATMRDMERLLVERKQALITAAVTGQQEVA